MLETEVTERAWVQSLNCGLFPFWLRVRCFKFNVQKMLGSLSSI